MVVDKSKTKIGRALQDEAELDDDALDAIVGGRGRAPAQPGSEEEDAWSKVVEDHSVAMPAKRLRSGTGSPPAGGETTRQGRKARD